MHAAEVRIGSVQKMANNYQMTVTKNYSTINLLKKQERLEQKTKRAEAAPVVRNSYMTRESVRG
jgi:hypothetical protein